MRIGMPMNPPAKPARSRKKPLNVSVRADLVEEAKAFGTNISAVLERALEEEHRAKRREKWQRENRAAIQEANKELADAGLWSDGLRLF
jgi:antitoxin CcdA